MIVRVHWLCSRQHMNVSRAYEGAVEAGLAETGHKIGVSKL